MENTKAAEAGSYSTGAPITGEAVNENGGAGQEQSMIPNPKLGMAPLSSELAVAAVSNNISPESSSQPPPDPLQPIELQSTRTSVPPIADSMPPASVAADPPQVPPILKPSEPDAQHPPPDTTALPPDPTPTASSMEQPQLPDPSPTQPDPPLTDPPTSFDSHPPNPDSALKETD